MTSRSVRRLNVDPVLQSGMARDFVVFVVFLVFTVAVNASSGYLLGVIPQVKTACLASRFLSWQTSTASGQVTTASLFAQSDGVRSPSRPQCGKRSRIRR